MHHRGDEAHERDRGRQDRGRSRRSSPRTGNRWSSGSRCSSSSDPAPAGPRVPDRHDRRAPRAARAQPATPIPAQPNARLLTIPLRGPHQSRRRQGDRQAVREDPDRQSRRDRAAHPARVPRDGHQDGRRPLRGRPRRQVRAPRRRIGLHRSAAVRAELPARAGDHRRRRGDRRAGDPSGLRLPVRERGLRRQGREVRVRVHRPAPGDDPPDGRQGQREGRDDQGGRAVRARLRGRAARGREGGRAHRARGRLPRDHQGGRRRRRARHARRPHRGRAAAGGDADARGSAVGVRQSGRLHGEVPRQPAPHRDPGAGGRVQERRVPVRARLLDAAAPPEDHRGSAGARH